MLLPYRTLVLESALTPTQAVERLTAAVEPRAWPRRGRAQCPFEGTVEGMTFHLQRIIGYRNSFLPRLHGRIEAAPSGRARLVVSFRPHPAVAVFMGVWFGFLAMVATPRLRQPSPNAGSLDPRLVPGGMLAFGVILLFGAFVPEARKAARLLEEILSARWVAGGPER